MTAFFAALGGILSHPIFMTTALAWLVAQALKMVIQYFRAGKLDWKLLVETGGMPSSHSSFVASMTVCVGLSAGWQSPAFMVALGFAIITMHDAAGLRMAAGRQAALLNQIVESLYEGRKAKPPRMKELLGHSPLQVLSGALLGVAVAAAFYPLFRR
jgi:hypothetical protein